MTQGVYLYLFLYFVPFQMGCSGRNFLACHQLIDMFDITMNLSKSRYIKHALSSPLAM